MKYSKLALSIACLFAALQATATTFPYSLDDRLAAGEALSNDGWSSSGSEWTAGGYNGELYARNNVGSPPTVDRTIYRANDGDFSYTIPEGTTDIELTIRARTGSNFWEAGLSDGQSRIFGIGGDFVFGNEYYVLDGTDRFYESGSSAFGDVMETLILRFDLVAGTSSLFIGEPGSETVIRSAIPMTTTLQDLQGADGLFLRSDTQFAGASSITVTAVPEASTALLVLGSLVLFLGSRRLNRTGANHS
jgi:hypothetical protein